MSSDYLDQLDATSLGLLAEATGMASRAEAPRFFSERPNGIRLALGSPEADRLLAAPDEISSHAHRLLCIAIAVHRTAEEICSAGWTARDESPIDLPLLRFAGQGPFQALMVDLLASHLPADVPAGIDYDLDLDPHPAGTPARLHELIALCGEVAETERAGALRLLGDEALFTAGVCPATAAAHPVDAEMIDSLNAVLPRAVRGLLCELSPHMHTQLDVYLHFGPVWYRMASQNLLHGSMRGSLSDLATEFAHARRFLVRVAQGPLAPLRPSLFAVPA